MAGIKVSVDDKAASGRLSRLEEAVKGSEPLFRAIGSTIVNRVRLCFKLGIDPWGNPWAALKIRKGQPLRDSGLLNRSITSKPDSTGVTIGTNLKHDGVSYPAVHQFGAVIRPKPGFWSRPSNAGPGRQEKRLVFPGPNGRLIFAKKVTIPARPFLPLRKNAAVVALPPDWSAAVVRSIRTYLQKAASNVR